MVPVGSGLPPPSVPFHPLRLHGLLAIRFLRRLLRPNYFAHGHHLLFGSCWPFSRVPQCPVEVHALPPAAAQTILGRHACESITPAIFTTSVSITFKRGLGHPNFKVACTLPHDDRHEQEQAEKK